MAITHTPSHPSRPARLVDVPLAVWPVAQTSAQHQRAGRYHPGSARHPGKMLPALAARIVAEYSTAGQLVLDPMCGIGTTLVEATRLGRRAAGVELEAPLVALAEANLHQAARAGGAGRAGVPRPKVHHGDARQLPALLGGLTGTVDLVVLAPPYGCDTGMIDMPGWRTGQRLCPPGTRNYSTDKASPGQAHGPAYTAAMTEIYAACHQVLRPGGLLVTVTENTRRAGRCLDLAGLTVTLARSVGFTYLQHVIALLGPIRDGQLAARPSFWQLTGTRKARERGEPAHLGVHEDLGVFQARQVGR